jgi:hydrogenase/urease accessory protein HupE
VRSIKIIFLFWLLPIALNANDLRPAYFSLVQTTDSTYQLVWKLPALGTATPKIYPTLPTNWVVLNEQSNLLSDNLRRTYTLSIKGEIANSNIYFEGLENSLVEVILSIKLLNGIKYSTILKPTNPRYIIPLEPDRWSVVRTYIKLGFEHILAGVDHLLFVLALLLITNGFKKLVKTITAFTIAHSITLSLASLGVVGLPMPPVEAVIALSIVFLAIELINHYKGKDCLTAKYPWVVAFTFGLLHGFGFAGALAEVGLPQMEIPTALLFFNVGVELGQLSFVIAVMLLIWLINKIKSNWPSWVKWVPPYVIGSIAAFWLIERVASFWI